MRPRDSSDDCTDDQRFQQIATLLATGLRRLCPRTPCLADLVQQEAEKNTKIVSEWP
jgi:hypothetical protein